MANTVATLSVLLLCVSVALAASFKPTRPTNAACRYSTSTEETYPFVNLDPDAGDVKVDTVNEIYTIPVHEYLRNRTYSYIGFSGTSLPSKCSYNLTSSSSSTYWSYAFLDEGADTSCQLVFTVTIPYANLADCGIALTSNANANYTQRSTVMVLKYTESGSTTTEEGDVNLWFVKDLVANKTLLPSESRCDETCAVDAAGVGQCRSDDLAYCTSCKFGNLKDGKCGDNCGAGNVVINAVCTPCATGCATCVTNTTTCTSCTAGKVRQPNTNSCQNQCNSGYAANNASVCTACDSSCATCSTPTATGCLTCATGRFKFQSACVSSCPDGFVKSNTTDTCVSNSTSTTLAPVPGSTTPLPVFSTTNGAVPTQLSAVLVLAALFLAAILN